jgi:hypothetical protein
MTTSSPIVLAAGQITRADRLAVGLVKPPDMPAAVLIRWPLKPSVVEPNPQALASLAASLVRVLAEAQVRLAKINMKGRRS